ncbi:MAG: DUF502 domain-containing protein [Amaricoccus sp.]
MPGTRPRKTVRSGLLRWLEANFLRGLAVVLPAALTVLPIVWLVQLIDARVDPLVPGHLPFTQVAGVGVLIFAGFTTAAGMLTRQMLFQRVVRGVEALVGRLPVARQVHLGAKQMLETAIAKGDTAFRRPALVEYPRRGSWTVVLITGAIEGELPVATSEPDLLGLLVPTAPNPITGFLIFAPRRDVIPLDMALDDAAKLVISAGLVPPPV